MRKIVRLTESDLIKIVKRVINESEKKLSTKWYGVKLAEIPDILKNDYGWDGELTQKLVDDYENSVIFNVNKVAYNVTSKKYAEFLYMFIKSRYKEQMPRKEDEPWRGSAHDNPYGPFGDWGQHASTAWG